MSDPLGEQQLAAIRDRVVLAQDIAGRADWLLSQYKPVRASLADVPALLAEVERLTAQVEATSFDEAATGVEAEHLKGRITELETERHSTNEALSEATEQLAARTFYLADYEGISDGPTLHTAVDAAKAWVSQACAEFNDPAWDWYEQDGTWQQWTSDPDTDRPTSRGAGSVTPLTVQGDGIVAEAQRIRQQLLKASAQAALLTEVRDSQKDEIRRLQTEQGEVMKALGCGRHDEWGEVVHRARQLAGGSAVTADAAERTVWRAEHHESGMVLGHYATRQAAMDHIHATLAVEENVTVAAIVLRVIWRADDPDGPEDAETPWECWLLDADTEDDKATSYVVGPIGIESAYDPDGDQ